MCRENFLMELLTGRSSETLTDSNQVVAFFGLPDPALFYADSEETLRIHGDGDEAEVVSAHLVERLVEFLGGEDCVIQSSEGAFDVEHAVPWEHGLPRGSRG